MAVPLPAQDPKSDPPVVACGINRDQALPIPAESHGTCRRGDPRVRVVAGVPGTEGAHELYPKAVSVQSVLGVA